MTSMAGDRAFDVDIPVTDLDENVDDFFIEEPDNGGDASYNTNTNTDNMSIDLSNLDFGSSGSGLLSRSWRGLSGLWSGKGGTHRSRNGDYTDDIELINRNIHDLNSGSSDFLGFEDNASSAYYARPKRRSKFARYVCAVFHSRLLVYVLLLLIIALLIALLVVVSKAKRLTASSSSSSSSSAPFQKPLNSIDSSSSLLTIVLAIGALHPHFISQDTMPFLTNLLNSSQSVYSPYMRMENPASKLTNLWSLTTGLHPADHGIVGDAFYDPALKDTFVQYSKDPKWWKGEPIWRDADQYGMEVVTFNWPGADVVGGPYLAPDHYESFHEPGELNEQLEQLVRFLSPATETEHKPDLVLSYVSTLDKVVSANGLSGDALTSELSSVDSFVKKVYGLLTEKGMSESTNVIIVSEGGYAPTSPDRTLHLDELVDVSKLEHVQGFPIVGLNPIIEYSVSEMVDRMKAKLATHPLYKHFQVYAKDEVDSTLFGGHSDRISPILVVPDAGYLVATEDKVNALEGDYSYVSGYRGEEVLSRGVFIGSGPTFVRTFGERHTVLRPFDITDVYNIVCDSLSIEGDNGFALMSLEEEDPIQESWKDTKSYPGVDFPVSVLDHLSFFEAKFGTAENEELTVFEPSEPETEDSDANAEYNEDTDNSESNTEDTDTDTDDTDTDKEDPDEQNELPDTPSEPVSDDNGDKQHATDQHDIPSSSDDSDSWWNYVTHAVDDALDDVKHLLHPDDQPAETAD